MIIPSMLIAASLFHASLLQLSHAPAATEQELSAALKRLGTAFESKDTVTIKANMTSDNLSITPHLHCDDLDALLKAVEGGDLTISSYKIENLRVMSITDDVAAMTFDATIVGTYQGTKLSSPVQVIETWVRRDGKWLQATYQETASP